MKKAVPSDELDARLEFYGRLGETVVAVLAEHLPVLGEEEAWEAAFNLAEVVAWHDPDDRRPGGVEHRAALMRYLRAVWELRRAYSALPSQVQILLGEDEDYLAHLGSEIAALKLLRDMPRYRDKSNTCAVNVVATAREVWMEAHGTPVASRGALEEGGPTTSNAAFADFLQALLEVLEVEGARPGTVADAKSAFQAFVRYTGNRGPGGAFPMDDEP